MCVGDCNVFGCLKYVNIHLTPPHSTQLRVTLTNDNNKIFKALQAVEPAGRINFVTGVRIAHVS